MYGPCFRQPCFRQRLSQHCANRAGAANSGAGGNPWWLASTWLRTSGNRRAVSVLEAQTNPVLRRYRLRRLRLPMGQKTLDLVIPDGKQWLRAGSWVPAAERGAEQPYWIEIWPSSVAVARCLVRLGAGSAGLQGKRVLDLGCGLGVPGTSAASLGASVSFADMQPDALAFAAWNAQRAHPNGDAPACHLLDWSRNCVSGQFEILVLADVSYRPVHHRPLLDHVQSCLAAGGLVLHADPFRPESDGFLKSLRSMLASVETAHDTAVGDRRVRVRVTCAAKDVSLLPSLERKQRATQTADEPGPSAR